MKSPHLSRRSFTRTLLGLFAFIPAAKSLTALLPTDPPPPIIPADEFEMMLKTRIAKGKVLALEGDVIWISDWQVDKLGLVITDDSVVWKGKYNKGKNFDSYPYKIEPDDDVIALGQRNGNEFFVEKMYANIVNTYITVDAINLDQDGAMISYTDGSKKRSAVKVRPDYLINGDLYKEVVDRGQQLVGMTVQIIGLPLKDGTIVAANVLI